MLHDAPAQPVSSRKMGWNLIADIQLHLQNVTQHAQGISIATWTGMWNVSAVILAILTILTTLTAVTVCQVYCLTKLVIAATQLIIIICLGRDPTLSVTTRSTGIHGWHARGTSCSCISRDVWPEGCFCQLQALLRFQLCASQHTRCPLTCALITCQGLTIWQVAARHTCLWAKQQQETRKACPSVLPTGIAVEPLRYPFSLFYSLFATAQSIQ
jgi:hypothetical protein